MELMKKKVILTMLPLDVCDILVAVQPSSEKLHSAIWSGSCLIFKFEDNGLGISHFKFPQKSVHLAESLILCGLLP
jgi:hypothetical protein